MKNVTRKLFVLLVAFACVFTLAGCGGSKKQLEEANNKIAELEEKLAQLTQKNEEYVATNQTLNDTILEKEEEVSNAKAALDEAMQNYEKVKNSLDATEADMKEAQAALDEAQATLDEAQAALDKVQVVLEEVGFAEVGFVCDGISFDKLEESLGEADDFGMYTVKTGQTFNLSAVLSYSYTQEDAEEPLIAFNVATSLFALDYMWDVTYDYNMGLEINGSEVTAILKGCYYISIIDNMYVTDEEGNVDATGSCYAVATGAVPGDVIIVNVVNNLEVGFGDEYEGMAEFAPNETAQINVSEGFTVVSYASSDNSVATVSESGLVTTVADGNATISVVVKNNSNEEDVRTRLVSVKVVTPKSSDLLAGGSEGMEVNFKYAPVETQTKILAYMERALINAGASIPMFNNSGLVIYSERVNFIADEYVANMGYGPTAVAPDTGKGAGTAEDPAYRMWTSADPSTLNHLNYADSVESDFLTLVAGSLITFDWKLDENGKGIGFEVKPEMLSVLPYPVDAEGQKLEFSGLDGYTTWKFDLRKDLKWANGDAMNANDFMYTFKLALDPKLNMKRANYFYGGSAAIAGAEAYFKGKTDDWSTVGIKQVDDYSFTITFANELKQWDVCYNYSGFLYTPVHQATWEANLAADGTPRYGTSKDSYMASGMYTISYWEKGKEYRFAKNDNYFLWNNQAENVQVSKPGYENMSYTIVQDANASLELFKAGLLDVTSVPASAYDEFKSWPNQKFAPGATAFRLSTNRLTQAEIDAQFGVGAWEAKPIMQEDDFMWALYFGMDRSGVQAITKTSTAWDSYFTDAYSIVTPTEEGTDSVTYRHSDWGKKVYEGIDELDYDLNHDTLGYAPALAVEFYIAALESMQEKGVFSSSQQYEVYIEIASFDGATHEAIFAFVVDNYNKLFNSEAVKEAFPNVTFRCEYAPQPGMDVYYAKQMAGKFDLAIAGISGGVMEPAGFMECFCDDNRSGLLLSLGFDSHNANILINLDIDGDGQLDGEKYWSFDALYSALMGKTFVKNGMEAEAPAEE